ncbi:hypothetical protein [Streptomyces goshikiensis]|uniref:hypothetical protein n=1 Tax=Streptomyces goshikiensis TaxID=1942 RepID=UPI003658888C
MRAFGAAVTADGPTITVRGPSPLTAARTAGHDIRAVAALVIAALAAEGTSTLHGVYHLQRGYGHLLSKLAALGAELTVRFTSGSGEGVDESEEPAAGCG